MLHMSTSKTTFEESLPDCPSQSLLKDYWLGLSDEFVSGKVDRHLETCESCNRQLTELESDSSSKLEGSGVGLTSSELDEESRLLHEVVEEAKRATHPLPSNEPPATIGPYHLLQLIGRGGMGRVYRATHQHLHREVAIKLLPILAADPLAIERFNREVQAAGRIQHPALVNATDAGVAGDHQFLVMEFIDGWDLGKLIPHLPNIRIADACELIRQIALGLASAHSLGMVHRDIKPSNIMLDRNGNAKLLDFGLVLLDRWDGPASELTSVGQFLGTLDYMAPEQAERSTLADHRSDIYSLGATLFRLLTQQHPLAMLPMQSPMEKLRVLTKHHPLRIQTLRSDVPNELAGLIDQMLSTRSEDRPVSAAHVAEALLPWSQGANLRELATEIANRNLATLTPSPDVPKVQLPQAGKGRGVFRFGWVLLACLLPLAFYLGITLTLESRLGNLVVESTVDDLKIRVEPLAGATSREWQIHQGAMLTRLDAGDYRIILEGNADGVSIDHDVIKLSRGETVIARITRQAPSDSKPESPSLASAIGRSTESVPGEATDLEKEIERLAEAIQLPNSVKELRFKGESCSEILESLLKERDQASWREAFEKLLVLLSKEQMQGLGPLLELLCQRHGFVVFPEDTIAQSLRPAFLNQHWCDILQRSSSDTIYIYVFGRQVSRTLRLPEHQPDLLQPEFHGMFDLLERRLSQLSPAELARITTSPQNPGELLGIDVGAFNTEAEKDSSRVREAFARYPWCSFLLVTHDKAKSPSSPWLVTLLKQCAEKQDYSKFHYLRNLHREEIQSSASLKAIVNQELVRFLESWIASGSFLPNKNLGLSFATVRDAGFALGMKSYDRGSDNFLSRAMPMNSSGNSITPFEMASRLRGGSPRVSGSFGGRQVGPVRRFSPSRTPVGNSMARIGTETNQAGEGQVAFRIDQSPGLGFDSDLRSDLVPEAFLVLVDCASLDRTEESFKTLLRPQLEKLASMLETCIEKATTPDSGNANAGTFVDYQWNQQGLWATYRRPGEGKAVEHEPIQESLMGKRLAPSVRGWVRQIALGDLLSPTEVVNEFLSDRKRFVLGPSFGLEEQNKSLIERWFVEPPTDQAWLNHRLSGSLESASFQTQHDTAVVSGTLFRTYSGGLGGVNEESQKGPNAVTFQLQLKEAGWRIRSWKFAAE